MSRHEPVHGFHRSKSPKKRHQLLTLRKPVFQPGFVRNCLCFFLWLLITFDSFDLYSSLRMLLGFCWDPGSSESHSLSARDPERCRQLTMPTFRSIDPWNVRSSVPPTERRVLQVSPRGQKCTMCMHRCRSLSEPTKRRGTNGASLVVSCSQTCEVIVKPCTSMEAVLRIFFPQICEANHGKSGQPNAKPTPMLILRPGQLNWSSWPSKLCENRTQCLPSLRAIAAKTVKSIVAQVIAIAVLKHQLVRFICETSILARL